MTAFAPLPESGEAPVGMLHVGWRCTSPDHDCLVPLSAAEPSAAYPGGEVYLEGHNHHANWTPVYVHVDMLEEPAAARALREDRRLRESIAPEWIEL